MNNKTFTYKKSGVNIDRADKFVNFISKITYKNKGNKKAIFITIAIMMNSQ